MWNNSVLEVLGRYFTYYWRFRSGLRFRVVKVRLTESTRAALI